MSKRLLIVGGVAGGATAAARARRLDEDAEIVVFERGKYISFANCGLPYHVGGEISQRSALLVQTKARLGQRYALDIRTEHEVLSIDRAARTVQVRDVAQEHTYTERYDVLLLSPGAEPARPPLPGADHPRVYTLRSIPDVDRIKRAVDEGAQRALVVGGGFIGLELAENLRRRGLEVTLVELLPQVMPPLDPEMAALVHEELDRQEVTLRLGDGVTFLEEAGAGLRARLKHGGEVEADLVVLAVGVRPESGLAREAGLALGARGHIVVDEHMRTSDDAIYAVGDAVEVQDAVLGGATAIPLAGPANRQARIAVDHIFGRASRYRGTQGTSIVRAFDLTVGCTGLSEKVLRQREVAYRKVYVNPNHHVGYFPGAHGLLIKLLFAAEDGRVLGAQVVGREGVDKRVDVLALAIQGGMTVYDLEEAELAYAPQYGAAKDPVNMAGFVAANWLRGDVAYVYAEDLGPEGLHNWTVLDVRDGPEYMIWHIPGAVLIPLSQLRESWEQLPKDKPVAVYCASGQRSYYACRFLRQKGVSCENIAGGESVYRRVHAGRAGMPPAASPTSGCGG
jgi:NADPH-dependent 2,4-dienoyl-CoA reductase/sulfur reductase-like enzyme/rhodanese-related sulfurtransferase